MVNRRKKLDIAKVPIREMNTGMMPLREVVTNVEANLRDVLKWGSIQGIDTEVMTN